MVLVLRLDLGAGGRLTGTIGVVQGEAPACGPELAFDGWLDLMTALEGLRRSTAGRAARLAR